MRSYNSGVPRAAVGFAAVVMTALTLGALVILPASMEGRGEQRDMLAASSSAAGHCSPGPAQLRASEPRATDVQHCLHAARELLTTN